MDDNGGSQCLGAYTAFRRITQATVLVPYGTTTGNVTVGGVAGSFPLQVVPVIRVQLLQLRPGSTLFLRGSGFIEGDNRALARHWSTTPIPVAIRLIRGITARTSMLPSPMAHSRARLPSAAQAMVEVDAPLRPPNTTPKIVNSGGTRIQAPDGSFSTLIENADKSFVMTTKNGIKHNFNAAGLQTSTVDRHTTATATMAACADQYHRPNDWYALSYQQPRQHHHRPRGRVTKLAYDGAGNLTSITDPDSSVRYLATTPAT